MGTRGYRGGQGDQTAEMKTIKIELRNLSMGELALALACPDADHVFELDFADEPCYPNRIVPLLALADDFRRRGSDIRIRCIPGSYLERVCGPFARGRMSPESETELPSPFDRVWSFSTAAGQNAIFNAMLMQLTKSAVLGQGVKESFMWCLNEVMDNVLNHSAPVDEARGYVMTQFYRKTNCLTVCVFDLGKGLKASLEGTRFSVSGSYEAILAAVKPGVTSGNGQGNGLWGLRELLARAQDGTLFIGSGDAAHRFSPRAEIDGRAHYEPLPGYQGTTLVDFQMKCGSRIDFDGVFGEGFAPVDIREESMETEDGTVRLRIAELAKGTGTRESAREIRNQAENIIDNESKRVLLDFDAVSGCSSSFVDELVGKLLAKYGFLAFTQAVVLRNVAGMSAQLVNRSISQRLSGFADGRNELAMGG